MKITVTFTTGHISIKRGRITRNYGYIGHDITVSSFHRLCNVLNYGPCYYKSTQRSTINEWHGLSTLNTAQKALLNLYVHLVKLYRISGDELYHLCRQEQCYPFELPGYQAVCAKMDACIACKDACSLADIHPILIELVTPCEHGNAQSRCYTCATTY